MLPKLPVGTQMLIFSSSVISPSLSKGGIGVYVVNDLWDQSADIDGVGGREHIAVVGNGAAQLLVGKDGFDSGLRIVKIAVYRCNVGIVAFLRNHLKFLHIGDTLVGVENRYFCSGNVCKACQRRLAGVSGGGSQNEHVLARGASADCF